MTLILGPVYVAKAGAVFTLVVLVVLSRLRAYHPFPRFGAANQLTLLRALLVSFVAALIGEPMQPLLAAALAATVTGLDGVDGWLARRSKMTSAFGARFDVEVDALLIQVLAILVWQYDKAGPWVLVSGLLRYVFVAAAWFVDWMSGPLPPTRRAKVICVVQLAALMIAIVPWVTLPTSELVAGIGLAALVYSFAVDVSRLWSQREAPRPSRHG